MAGLNNLNQTIRKSLVGSLICGAGALVGGLVGGPIGIGIGSVVGGAISARVLNFRSAPDVMQHDFTEAEQMTLAERGRQFLMDSKEYLFRLVLDIVTGLLKCESKNDIINVLRPLFEEGLGFIIRSLIRYLTC